MANIAAEIDGLQRLTTGKLAERYEALHGRPRYLFRHLFGSALAMRADSRFGSWGLKAG